MSTGHPESDASQSDGVVRHRVRASAEIEFDIAVSADAPDAISQEVAQGRVFENRSLALLLTMIRSGQTVLDLGAHVGTLALAAAAAGCRVIAVEASAENAGLLQKSAELNQFHDFQVVQAAVSDQRGTLKFFSCGPYGHVATESNEAQSVEVPAVPVDEMLAEMNHPRVDFIKLDVEGSEIKAIEGMRSLLSGADAPAVLVESNGHTLNFYGRKPSELMAEFRRLGYVIYMIGADCLVETRPDEVQPAVCLDYFAVKRPLGNLNGWSMRPPLSDEETIRSLVEQSRAPTVEHRSYVARALADAPESICADRRIARVIALLKKDPHEIVRTDAWPLTEMRSSEGWLARWKRRWRPAA